VSITGALREEAGNRRQRRRIANRRTLVAIRVIPGATADPWTQDRRRIVALARRRRDEVSTSRSRGLTSCPDSLLRLNSARGVLRRIRFHAALNMRSTPAIIASTRAV